MTGDDLEAFGEVLGVPHSNRVVHRTGGQVAVVWRPVQVEYVAGVAAQAVAATPALRVRHSAERNAALTGELPDHDDLIIAGGRQVPAAVRPAHTVHARLVVVQPAQLLWHVLVVFVVAIQQRRHVPDRDAATVVALTAGGEARSVRMNVDRENREISF